MFKRFQCSLFRRLVFGVVTSVTFALGARQALAQDAAPLFDSPEAAVQALLDATKSPEEGSLVKVFGEGAKDMVSGDDVQDKEDVANFGRSLAAAHRWVTNEDGSMTLNVGRDNYPFPIPLVQRDGKWAFDVDAGKDEIINRRVGRNELLTIAVCRAYVVAQREYAAADRDGDDVLEFAQKLRSTPGQRDGLFWESAEGEALSPLGPLIAEARAHGYLPDSSESAGDGPQPYHGYVYRILTRQGAKAPGGAYDYVINGNMVAGFAAVASPVAYGDSGVMTFLVGPNGVVYEKDLGEETAAAVAQLIAFEPDESWHKSDSESE